jgi:hypothetical protein
MNDAQFQKELNEAITAADNALYCLNSANKYLSSAGNWGIVDILGGGFFSTLVKHSKIDDAKREIENAKYALAQFTKELRDIGANNFINIEIGGFLTFADYFFDGLVADWLVQSKIRDAQNQVNQAIAQVNTIKNQLLQYR